MLSTAFPMSRPPPRTVTDGEWPSDADEQDHGGQHDLEQLQERVGGQIA